MKRRPMSAGRFSSVIFDFDYTLADSSPGVIECVNYALQKLGFPARSPDAIRALIGLSLAQTYRELSGDRSGECFAEFEEHFVKRGDQVMLQSIHLFDTVRPTAQALLAEGLTLAIVSTKYRRRIVAVLEREGLKDAFAVVVGGEDVPTPKPDPSGLKAALARLSTAPAEALYVGDSAVDAETARRAGVPFAAVLSGVTSRETLATYEPYAILDDLTALPEMVL